MRYPHLFFDLDHTLWDFEANKNAVLYMLWEETRCRQTNTTFEQFRQAFDRHSEALWVRFRNGEVSRAELRLKRFARALLELKIPQEKLAEKLSIRFLEELPKQSALVPYAFETVQYCVQQGHQLYIITNGFETTQRAKIERAGLAPFFRKVFSSESCGYPKPHPAIFATAQTFARALPADCLMIGDALEADIGGAQSAGWDSVYFNPAGKAHTEQPTYEIACLRELKGLLG